MATSAVVIAGEFPVVDGSRTKLPVNSRGGRFPQAAFPWRPVPIKKQPAFPVVASSRRKSSQYQKSSPRTFLKKTVLIFFCAPQTTWFICTFVLSQKQTCQKYHQPGYSKAVLDGIDWLMNRICESRPNSSAFMSENEFLGQTSSFLFVWTPTRTTRYRYKSNKQKFFHLYL